MPTKNIVKEYGAGEYYHIYNRGVAKQDIFRESYDYEYMLWLFKKYLSGEKVLDKLDRQVPDYSGEVELVAYCLMPNHYHFLLYLKEQEGIVHLMRSVMTAYGMYFNKKYKRVGGLFQNHFLASRITSDAYYWHISRYIHLNPVDLKIDYLTYPYSSIGYYRGDRHARWLHEEHMVQTQEERRDYIDFVKSYEATHEELAVIKHLLANESEIED